MSILAPFQLLELNIISAQDLYRLSGSMKTYAVAWVHPDRKLSTRVDSLGGTNPTWNDKFVFRVDEDFLYSDTSAVMIEIHAIHWFKDVRLGSVRALVGNLVPPSLRNQHQQQRLNQIGMRFVALQVRRSSGRPQGILNIGVTILDSSMRSMPLYTQLSTSAVGYRHLMGEEDPQIRSSNNIHGNEPQPLVAKPELRRVKSHSSSMVTPAERVRLKRDTDSGAEIFEGSTKGKKGRARSAINGSEITNIGRGSSLLNGSDLGDPFKITRNTVVKKFNLFNFNGRKVMTESELGPSPSEAAAAMVHRPQQEAESSIMDARWSFDESSVEGLQSKLERWRTELPPVHDRGGEFVRSKPSGGGKGHNRRHTDDGGGLFSCFSNICGCQCSIVCGAGAAPARKKVGKGRPTRSPSAENLSFL